MWEAYYQGHVSDADTERVAVKTYVPAYQREVWDDHADDLGMSRSEFVRSMVQAGRRGFGAAADDEPDTQPDGESDSSGNTGRADTPKAISEGAAPTEQQVVALLEETPRDWDELVAALTEEVEQQLDETLQRLQEEGRVRYSGRDGGYVLQ